MPVAVDPAAASPSRAIAAEAVVADLADHAHRRPGLGCGGGLVGALAAGGELVARAEHGLARPRQGLDLEQQVDVERAEHQQHAHTLRSAPSRAEFAARLQLHSRRAGARRAACQAVAAVLYLRGATCRVETRMIEPEEIIVDAKSVACDGGGVLGHPLVYLAIPASGRADCPYCGRIFLYRAGAPSGAQIAEQAPPGVNAGDPTAAVDAEPQG